MGIDIDTAKFLFSAHRQGINFDKVLTLGQQTLIVDDDTLSSLLRLYNLNQSSNSFEIPENSQEFFKLIGAKQILSMDVSDYEGASILHDLNLPVNEELKERFSVVFDGGTLEHVFNYPIAIQSAMDMVAPDGHLIIIAPGNNFCGHGFYQFSPELFFRVLSEENGFKIKRMVATEVGSSSWYDVADPAHINKRVNLINDNPVYLMILAQKIRSTKPFAKFPQQSDYVFNWEHGSAMNEKNGGQKSKLKSWLRKNYYARSLYRTLMMFLLRRKVRKNFSFENKDSFTPSDSK